MTDDDERRTAGRACGALDARRAARADDREHRRLVRHRDDRDPAGRVRDRQRDRRAASPRSSPRSGPRCCSPSTGWCATSPSSRRSPDCSRSSSPPSSPPGPVRLAATSCSASGPASPTPRCSRARSLVRRPLVGVAWEFFEPSGDGAAPEQREDWRAVPALRRAYTYATLGATAVFLARGVVQLALFDQNSTGWLAFARIAMGYPLTIVAVGYGFWVVSRRAKEDRRERQACRQPIRPDVSPADGSRAEDRRRGSPPRCPAGRRTAARHPPRAARPATG